MKYFYFFPIFLCNSLIFFIVALFGGGCTSDSDAQRLSAHKTDVALMSEKEIKSPMSREQQILQLKNQVFDVLIIGGGATGAGAALDAANRGLKTALIERNDFSSGTSSRSTKLVHGGVRYLENAVKKLDIKEYELVRDALAERKHFLENAPHLTNPLPILTPVYSWFEAAYYLIGLKLYDFISGASSLGNSEFMSKKSALKLFPLLKKENLKGGVVYFDGQFNDSRMNITILLTAMREGALAVNYVSAEGLLKDTNNQIIGAQVFDHISKESWPLLAKVVINATGTYADAVRKMDNPLAENIMIASQGSHVILPGSFCSSEYGLIIPKTKDDRVLFLLPWLGKAMAGTTDHPEKISDFPFASNEEIDFILEHLVNYFDMPVQRSDVIATWSGLRPLAQVSADNKQTAFISRDHLIEVSPAKLITIVGGKWTTYRKMAEDVINTAVSLGNLSFLQKSMTRTLKLVGARFFKENLAEELVAYEGLPKDVALHLATSYGDRVDAVIDIHNKTKRARLIEGFPYIEAEVIYAVTDEYAVHATDVIARRMRLAFLDNRAASKVVPKVISLMAQELHWSEDQQKDEFKNVQAFLATMFTPAKD